ncbi:MAG: thioesterase family protein, partial [Actinobacteria bacterium]|nr:thioesterase family protein [Actinomycetota bacterium]
MQQVVFNANYLEYCDDAVDRWIRVCLNLEFGHDPDAHFDMTQLSFDFMVKTLTITWTTPVKYGDVLDMTCRVVRWGNTSFDVEVAGRVGGEEKFLSAITYVSVDPSTHLPATVPTRVRHA